MNTNVRYITIIVGTMPYKIQPIKHFYPGKHYFLHIATPNISIEQPLIDVNGLFSD